MILKGLLRNNEYQHVIYLSEIGVALVNLEKADSSSKTTTGAPSTEGRFRLVHDCMSAC